MNDTPTWEELGTEPLEPDAPITVCAPLLVRARFALVHVQCQSSDLFGWSGVTDNGKRIRTRLAVDEGRTWIRGHHTEDSQEGSALLVTTQK